MRLYIGITKENELYYIEWDKIDNKQNNRFSLCCGTYDEPLTEQEGEERAREILKTKDYWENIGFLSSDNNFLSDFINFDDVADHVLSLDGWENTTGEYNHFGEYKNEEIYLNCSSGGQHQEKRENIKDLWISEEDFKKINKLWDKKHLKPLKEIDLKFMVNIFEKYKYLCSEQEILIKYLKGIKWQQ